MSVDNPYIIMEYMQGGSVADRIHKDFCSLEWKLIIKWVSMMTIYILWFEGGGHSIKH